MLKKLLISFCLYYQFYIKIHFKLKFNFIRFSLIFQILQNYIWIDIKMKAAKPISKVTKGAEDTCQAEGCNNKKNAYCKDHKQRLW